MNAQDFIQIIIFYTDEASKIYIDVEKAIYVKELYHVLECFVKEIPAAYSYPFIPSAILACYRMLPDIMVLWTPITYIHVVPEGD